MPDLLIFWRPVLQTRPWLLNRRTAATYQGAGFTFLRMNTKS